MNNVQIISEIEKLPLIEQEHLLKNLTVQIELERKSSKKEKAESKVEKELLARGILKEIPVGLSDEEEAFEPIEVKGKPTSEMIIEERR